MGRAAVSEDAVLEIDGISVTVTPVNVGNPHAVCFLPEETDAENISLAEIGPRIEKHPAFPGGVNAEFVSLTADGGLRMRVWERGSGITMACGTGACASAAAAVKKGLRRPGEIIPVHLDGGTLEIEVSRDFAVTMTGPAEFVYEGEISDD
jgi:diaminopimelate epimerase